MQPVAGRKAPLVLAIALGCAACAQSSGAELASPAASPPGARSSQGAPTARSIDSGAPHSSQVTSTPTVLAEQSGPWNVGVAGTVSLAAGTAVSLTGTPAVNIANMPSVSLAGTPAVNVANLPPITIGNSASSPAMVRSTDGLARERFEVRVTLSTTVGSTDIAHANFQVPAGKRFVVEDLNGVALRPEADLNTFIEILAPTDFYGLAANGRVFSFAPVGATGSQYLSTLATRTNFSIDEGSVNVYPGRGFSTSPPPVGSTALFDVWITGYLIDASAEGTAHHVQATSL